MANDLEGIDFCDVFVDGSYDATLVEGVDFNTGENGKYEKSGLAEGQHSWYMNCTDVESDDIQTDAASTGIRFNTTTGFTFANTVWNVTSTNALADVSWAEANENGAPTAPSTPLYWLIKLPSSGLTGSCSTTVRIAAAESS